MSTAHTFVAYVEDKPGVLNRVASLFRRRSYNIVSLTVGRTDLVGVSRLTVVMEADDDAARRIEANLYKLVNVLHVQDVTHEQLVSRDLALVKVRATPESRASVLQLGEVFRARVVDVAPLALTFEITGTADKIDGFLEVLRPFGVLEMVRTGLIAMTRGDVAGHVDPATRRAWLSPAREMASEEVDAAPPPTSPDGAPGEDAA
jgi:acetolactate synthase-1/3 small subunit